MEAYHTSPNNRKPDLEYVRRYGYEPVNRYMLAPTLGAAYLPSEDVAKINMLSYVVAERRNAKGLHDQFGGPLAGCIFIIFVAYFPIEFTARRTQWIVAITVSVTSRAAEARKEYFAKFSGAKELSSSTNAFAIALVMSLINSVRTIRPEDQAAGLTILDLTGALLVLGYFSGLWIRLVSHVVDIGFIAMGRNPHKSIWDDAITLAVMTPILLFIFNNSLLTVLTGSVTALASGAFAKWSAAREDVPKPARRLGSSSSKRHV